MNQIKNLKKKLKKFFHPQYGRQNIENVRKLTHPATINRLDSEDERNTSGTTEISNDGGDDTPTDVNDHVDFTIGDDPQQTDQTIDNKTKLNDKTIEKFSFMQPRPLTATSSETRLHEKHLTHTRSKSYSKPPNGYSNGNTVISRDDALILLPDGGKHTTDGFSSSVKAPKSDNEKSNDPEVNGIIVCPYFKIIFNAICKNSFTE